MTTALASDARPEPGVPQGYVPYRGRPPEWRRPTEEELALRRRRAAMGFRRSWRSRLASLSLIARPWFDSSRGVWGANLVLGRVMLSLGVTYYRGGQGLSDHTDCDNPNWVAVLVLKKPRRGGEFHVLGPSIFRSSRLNVFRGDLYRHHVQPHEGARVVLMAQFALDPVDHA